MLAGRGARPAAHRGPRHARLDRGDPPARRRPAPVPGQPGPVRDDRPADPHPGARARAADGPRARGRRRARGPSPRAPRDASPPRWTGRGEGTVDELLPEVYGDVTEQQLPVARFSLWAHLRALGQEGRAVAGSTPPRGRGHHRDPLGRRLSAGRAPARLSRRRRPPWATAASTRSSRRAEQPCTSTIGATSSATTRAISSKTAPSSLSSPAMATGTPASPPAARSGCSGMEPDQRHAEALGQALAAAGPEERVRRAVLAGEVAHVLDHPGHPQVAPARHVGRPGRHLLRRHRRRRDHEQLGAGQQAGQPHLDVAGPRREVDEEVVEVAPVGVLQELLHGPGQDEPAPHDRLLLVGQEPHRQHPHGARPDGALERDHLPRPGLDVALHAQQAGDGEAPDVGVEDPDGQAPGGQGHGQVDRDRRLADAALARRDGQDPGRGGDRRLGGVLAGLPAGPGHDGGPLLGVHGRHLHVDRAHPVEGPHVVDDVLLDLAPQRAGGDGQRHVDDDVAALDGDAPDHAQVDDGVAQLGVDDRPQAVADLLLAGVPARLPRRAASTAAGGVMDGIVPAWRGIPALARRGAGPRPAPVTWVRPWRTVRPGGRPPGVRRNEEDPVTTMSTSVNIGKKPAPVTLSDGATAKVAELLAQEEGEELALRVAVKPGGCSGYSYEMFFDTEVMPDDVVREFGAVRVVVDSAQRRAADRLDARVQRRPAGRRLQHHQPQRHPHLRLRLLLQLSLRPPRPLSGTGTTPEQPPTLGAPAPAGSSRSSSTGTPSRSRTGSPCSTPCARSSAAAPSRTAAARRVSAVAARCGSTGRPAWPASRPSAASPAARSRPSRERRRNCATAGPPPSSQHGASQCGFCTPGIVMRLAALEGGGTRAAPPTRRDIEAALRAHLCRCTGWQSIVEAALQRARASTARRARPRAIPATRCWPPGGPRSKGPAFQTSGPDVVLGGGGFADDSAPPDALVQLGADAPLAPSLRAARAGSGRVQGRNSTVPLSHPVERARGRVGAHAADDLGRAGLRRARRQLVPARASSRPRPWPTAAPSAASGAARSPAGARELADATGRRRPRAVAARGRRAARAQAPAPGRGAARRRQRRRPRRPHAGLGRPGAAGGPRAGRQPRRARSSWSTSPGRRSRPTCAAPAGPRCWRRAPRSDAARHGATGVGEAHVARARRRQRPRRAAPRRRARAAGSRSTCGPARSSVR